MVECDEKPSGAPDTREDGRLTMPAVQFYDQDRGFKLSVQGLLITAAMFTGQLSAIRIALAHRSAQLEQAQVAEIKYEFLLLLGWLTMFWIIGAASSCGFILTAFFCLLTIARVLKAWFQEIIERMPKQSLSRHYCALILAIGFFLAVAARACYISMAIVDTGATGGI